MYRARTASNNDVGRESNLDSENDFLTSNMGRISASLAQKWTLLSAILDNKNKEYMS